MGQSFSDYYEKAMENLSATTPAQAPVAPSSRKPLYPKGAPKATPKNSNPDFFKDPIGATFDFLSRGVYGATNVVAGKVDDAVQAGKKIQAGDVGGGIAELLGKTLFDINAGGRFVEGLTTSDADKKDFFSDTIEESTDKIGKQFDPDYLDRVDNVSGVLKGGLGLAGDLALDPLGYVPIPVGAIVKGARAGVKAVGGAAKKGKTVEQVAETSVKEASAVSEAPKVMAEATVSPREAMTIPMPESQAVPPTPTTLPASSAREAAPAPTARTYDDLVQQTEDYDRFIQTPSPALSDAEATISRVEALLSAKRMADASPVAPTAAKVEQVAQKADLAPVVGEAPAVAQGIAQAQKATRPSGSEILEKFAALPDKFDVPDVKGKVTSQYARDAFLAVAQGKRVGPRQKAVYEWVVSRSEETPAPGTTPLTEGALEQPSPSTVRPQAVEARTTSRFETPRDEARWLWSMLQDSDLAIRTSSGDVKITRPMLEQALHLETRGELPDGWADNLATLRAEADTYERFLPPTPEEPVGPPAGRTPEERQAIHEAAELTDENDAAAKWLAENDQPVNPEALAQGRHVQGEALATSTTPTGLRVSDALLAMTPGEIIATSKQAERMRGLLDTLEYMVKEGKAGGSPERVPIIPQSALGDYDPGVVRGFLSSKEAMALGGAERLVSDPALLSRSLQNWVITNYVDSFDRWVTKGLDDLADKGGRVTVLLSDGREVKASVEDIQDWLDYINNGLELKPEQYAILQGVDTLFREEIAFGNVMNPARESVEIHNVVDAWQYLVREKNEWLQANMGEIAYEFLTDSKLSPAKLAARFQVMRDLLTPDYSIDVLENLRELDRLQRPTLTAVARELNFEGQIRELLNPSPVQDVPTVVPDPTPTTPHKEAEAVAPEVVEEVVSQPSTITPKPSTPEEVEEIVEAMAKPATPFEPTNSPNALVKVVGDIIAKVTKRNIIDVPEIAPYRSASGAYRTSPELGEGFGWHLKKWNTQNQYSVEAEIWKGISDLSEAEFRKQGRRAKDISSLSSKNRAQQVEALWTDIHGLLDKALNKIGVKQVIGYGENLVPLSFGDIAQSITKHSGELAKSLGVDPALASDVRLLLLHNGKTRVNWTNLGDAIQVMLHGGSDDEIAAALLNTAKPGAKGAKETMPNNFAGLEPREGFHLTLGQRQKWYEKSIREIFPNATVTPSKGQNMYWLKVPGPDLADVMTRILRSAQDDLAKKAVNNGWRMAERGATEAYDMAAPVLQHLDDLYADPTKRGEFLQALAEAPETIAKAGSASGVYKESADTASTIVRTAVGDDVVKDAEELVKVDKATKPRGDKKKAKGTSKKVQDAIDSSATARVKAAVDPAEEAIDAQRTKEMYEANIEPRMAAEDLSDGIAAAREGAEVLDLAAPWQAEVATGFQRLINWGKETFRADFGNERIWDLTHNASLQGQEFMARTANSLNALSRTHTREEIAAAWQKIQLGVAASDNVQRTLEELVSKIWSPSSDGLFSNIFLNTEKNLEYVNDVIKMEFDSGKGFTPEFDLGAAKARSMEEFGNADLYHQFLAEQWRSWQIDDPADFLMRMTKAATTIAMRKSIVENFVSRAKRWGAMSTTPKPGFVSLPHTDNKSAFSVFLPQQIDGKPVYWEKELARELHRADVLTHTSRRMTGEIGDAVNKYFMPMQDAWKISVTVYRPGHHIRNAIGDASVTWVVRGNRSYMRSYKDAQKVLGMRNDYTDVDIVKAIRFIDNDETALPFKKGDVVVRGKFNGKDVALTAGEILDLTHRKGLRPTFHLGEGLYDDAILQSQWSRFWRKASLQDTRFNEFAGGVSQYRDHLARAQHFIQVLHQELGPGGAFTGKQFSGAKSLDELFDKAAAEVKKYHPDASMLTPRESKYMRVVIPFYSWFAKMLPNVLMLTLTKPGRVMAFPKASYELAVANGLNPDSIYDPFPEDQLFPSFLTEKALGPQFNGLFGQDESHYFGMNPGIAHLDVFNALGNDPVRGILGMSTPLLRVPFEALAGGSIGTGAKINDTSDYIDESIPGVNYLADVMGVSPTGTLSSVLTGQPGIDPQYQVARGNKEGFGSSDTLLALANWASGLGFQDMSRPNYINYAELERKRGEVPTDD